MPSETKENFLRLAGEQIRCNRARGFVLRELSDHLEDQENACRAKGIEDAEGEAVRSMGDPVLLGQQLDLAHRPKPALPMLAVTGVVLAAVSLLQVVFFFTGGLIDLWGYLCTLEIGLAALCGFYFLDFSLLARHPKVSLAVTFLASFLGFLAIPFNDQRIHVVPGALFFPPVFSVIIYLMRGRGLPGVLLCGGIALLFGYIPMLALMGTYGFTILLVCLILLVYSIFGHWFGGNRLLQLLCVFCGIGFLVYYILFRAYGFFPLIMERWKIYLNPSLEPWGRGYTARTVTNLLDGAQFIGHTRAGYDFFQWPLERMLPGWRGKYSLTYLIARFGWCAGVTFLAITAAFLFFLYFTIFRTKNRLGSLISLSIALMMTAELVPYVLNNLGMFLPMGPPFLPFLSTWRPVFVAHCGLMGLLLSCHRGQDIVKAYVPVPHIWRGKRLSVAVADGKLTVCFDFSRRGSET